MADPLRFLPIARAVAARYAPALPRPWTRDDLVSECWHAAWAEAERLGEGEPYTAAWRTARSQAVEFLRRVRAAKRGAGRACSLDRVAEDRRDGGDVPELGRPDPAGWTAGEWAAVLAAAGSPRRAEAVGLVYRDGLLQREAAGRMGVGVKAVESNLALGRAAIREALPGLAAELG